MNTEKFYLITMTYILHWTQQKIAFKTFYCQIDYEQMKEGAVQLYEWFAFKGMKFLSCVNDQQFIVKQGLNYDVILKTVAACS